MRPLSALLLLIVWPRCVAAQSDAAPPATLTLAQAIEATLRQHPLLHVQEEQVRSNRGALLRAQAQFDRVITSDASSGHTYSPLTEIERSLYSASSANTYLTTADVSANQQFRNGISAGPLLSVSRTTDNLGAQMGLNPSHLVYQVNVPLLRGRGRAVVDAPEAAAGMEIEASILDLNQTISDLLVNTVTSYWMAVSSRQLRDVYRAAEARGRSLVETVQALIAADKIPRSDLNQVLANLADRTSSRVGAEQQFLQAKQQLAIATGSSIDALLQAPEPKDPLPEAAAAAEQALQPAIARALSRRADFLASRRRVNEAEVLSKAAKNQLKPQLDLQFSTGYSGLSEGTRLDDFLVAPVHGLHGVDLTGGIHYQFPRGNRAAEGNVLSTDAAMRQADYRSQDTARNIASSVVVASQGVSSAARQLGAVDESVRQFQTALDNEREKYRLGVGSLIDVLTVEDRLTGVLTSQVQARLGYAIAIARLKQATGAVVDPEKTVQSVDPMVFLRP